MNIYNMFLLTPYSFFLVIDLDEHSAHAVTWRISPHHYKWLPSLNFCPHFVYEERKKHRWVMVQRNVTSKKKWLRHIPWAKTKVLWVLKEGTGLKLPMISVEGTCTKLRGPWTSYDIREQCQHSLQLYSVSSKRELMNGLLQSTSLCRCVSCTGHFSS